jgi:hypothetical protein
MAPWPPTNHENKYPPPVSSPSRGRVREGVRNLFSKQSSSLFVLNFKAKVNKMKNKQVEVKAELRLSLKIKGVTDAD